MSSKGMCNRRSFLKGATLAGGLVAMGGLAACATNSSSDAAAEQLSDTSGETAAPKFLNVSENVDFENKILSQFPDAQPILPEEPPESWDIEADFLVVGSGAGGLAAAIKLAESGANVVLLEKDAQTGGNSQSSAYFKCYGGTRTHERAGFGNYETYLKEIVPSTLKRMYEGLSGQSYSRQLGKFILIHEPEVFDWLEDHGATWAIDTDYSSGSVETLDVSEAIRLNWADESTTLSQRRNTFTLNFMRDKAIEVGVNIMLSTKATALILEGEKTIGMRAEGPDGAIAIKAPRGVLLAAGGCMDNRDMLCTFSPTMARAIGASMTNGSDTGECIRMGMGVGAACCGRNAFTGNDAGPGWEVHGSWNVPLYSGWTQVGGQPWLTIDRYGEIQTYYSTDPIGELANLYQDRLEMHSQDYRTFKILDSKYADYMNDFKQLTWRIPLDKNEKDLSLIPGLTDWREGMETAVSSGVVPSANTFDELGEKLGIRGEVIEAAVKEWNDCCAKGDGLPELGFPPEWMHPIENPPYYGYALGTYGCTSGFGLRVDEYMHVISANTDAPIPNLFACFHTAGGWGEDTWAKASVINQAALSLWSGYQAALTMLDEL